MINSLNSVLTIFVMIGIGFFLTKKGFFTQDTSQLFSKLIVKIALPFMMIANIPTRFTKEKLFNSLNGIIVAFLTVIITYIIAMIIAKVFKVNKNKRGLFCAMFAFANSIFIGLPINISLFGEDSATYVFLYYLANTSLFWTIGVSGIKRDGINDKKGFSKLNFLRKIFSPPLIGFLIGISLVLTEISLPPFIVNSFKYIGNLTTPLSLFFIGIVIYSIDFKEIKLDYPSYLIIIGRFLISPLIMFTCLRFFELPNLLVNVFMVESTMPIITQAALISKFYGGDSKYASLMVSITTVLSILIIPIYSFLLNIK